MYFRARTQPSDGLDVSRYASTSVPAIRPARSTPEWRASATSAPSLYWSQQLRGKFLRVRRTLNPDTSPATSGYFGKGSFNTTFPDGLSNTIMFAEHYANCGNPLQGPPQRNTLSIVWADSNGGFTPVFCTNNYWQPLLRSFPRTSQAYVPDCLAPQDNPDWLTTCSNEKTSLATPESSTCAWPTAACVPSTTTLIPRFGPSFAIPKMASR